MNLIWKQFQTRFAENTCIAFSRHSHLKCYCGDSAIIENIVILKPGKYYHKRNATLSKPIDDLLMEQNQLFQKRCIFLRFADSSRVIYG